MLEGGILIGIYMSKKIKNYIRRILKAGLIKYFHITPCNSIANYPHKPAEPGLKHLTLPRVQRYMYVNLHTYKYIARSAKSEK